MLAAAERLAFGQSPPSSVWGAANDGSQAHVKLFSRELQAAVGTESTAFVLLFEFATVLGYGQGFTPRVPDALTFTQPSWSSF